MGFFGFVKKIVKKVAKPVIRQLPGGATALTVLGLINSGRPRTREQAAILAVRKTLAKKPADPVSALITRSLPTVETTVQKIRRLMPTLSWTAIAKEVGLSKKRTQQLVGFTPPTVVKAATEQAPVRLPPPLAITPAPVTMPTLDLFTPRPAMPFHPKTFAPKRCIPPFFPDGQDGCELDLTRGEGGAGLGLPSTGVVVFEDAVTGSFGMPAIRPRVEMRPHRTCPTGMVLGTDGLCYPKAVLRRDSKFREWRPGTRPVLTGGEVRAIAKARSAITRGRDRMAGLGVTVKKK